MDTAQITALINTLDDGGLNTALEVRTVLAAFRDEVWKIGEIKMIKQDATFISANYDGTGLGLASMLGYALCNGNNGTDNYRRKTPVGYDPSTYVSGFHYETLGATFGEEKHTLIESELPVININGHTSVVGTTAGGGSGNQPWAPGTSDTIGGGQSHNNIQPSIVTVFIQRIA